MGSFLNNDQFAVLHNILSVVGVFFDHIWFCKGRGCEREVAINDLNLLRGHMRNFKEEQFHKKESGEKLEISLRISRKSRVKIVKTCRPII